MVGLSNIYFNLVLLHSFNVYIFKLGMVVKEVKTEIEISASPAKVWEILTDFEKWNAWNPIVESVSGNAALGNKLDVAMKGPEGKSGPRYSPVITTFEEGKAFRWRGKMMAGFLMTNDKEIILEGAGEKTQLIHKELFNGLLVPLFWGKMEQGVPGMLNAMNQSLKAFAEK